MSSFATHVEISDASIPRLQGDQRLLAALEYLFTTREGAIALTIEYSERMPATTRALHYFFLKGLGDEFVVNPTQVDARSPDAPYNWLRDPKESIPAFTFTRRT